MCFFFFRLEFLGLLKIYNCYYEGKSFQLRYCEEEGILIIEGFFNIVWGLRWFIWLQMQDDWEQVYFFFILWMFGWFNCFLKELLFQDGNIIVQGLSIQLVYKVESFIDSLGFLEEVEEVFQLMWIKSDVSCISQRRFKCCVFGEVQCIW